jgi:hypothetical protein
LRFAPQLRWGTSRQQGRGGGSEAYHAALAFYHNVQAAAKDDIPGAKAIFEDLKTRFPGGKRQGGTTETETLTETIKKQVKTG